MENGEWEDFGRKFDQNMKDKRAPVSVLGNMRGTREGKCQQMGKTRTRGEQPLREHLYERERAAFDSRERLYDQILLTTE